MAIVRRQIAQSERLSSRASAGPCPVRAAYPELDEFLTKEVWEDGSDRESGAFMVVSDEGRLKIWLKDEDSGCSCWITGATLGELFDRACAALAGGDVDWRPLNGKQKRRK